MRKWFLIAAAAIPSLGSAATPLHLAPSSTWDVDYAENSCRLIRHFGTGNDETTFALESEAPGALDMIVIGKPVWTIDDLVGARFLPLRSRPILGTPGRSSEKNLPIILFSNVQLLPDNVLAANERDEAERRQHPELRPPATSVAELAEKNQQRQAFADNTQAIQIGPAHNRPVILDTGSLGAAIKAFDKCSRDSLRDWGVDPDLEDRIVRRAWAPHPESWFSAEDYPAEFVVLGQHSVVKVRLLVDATGRVTKCTSLSHFNEPKFNKIVCDKFMQRAHFQPAELSDGTKVPSYYINKVVFRIGR